MCSSTSYTFSPKNKHQDQSINIRVVTIVVGKIYWFNDNLTQSKRSTLNLRLASIREISSKRFLSFSSNNNDNNISINHNIVYFLFVHRVPAKHRHHRGDLKKRSPFT